MLYTTLVTIPSLKEDWCFKQITTTQQKELCKLFLNEKINNTILKETIDSILIECFKDKLNFSKLNIIEKLLILIKLRCESIGTILELEIEKDGKKFNSEYNFFQKYIEIYQGLEKITPLKVAFADLILQCNIPNIKNEIAFNNIFNKSEVLYEDLIVFFIEKVYIKNQIIIFNELLKSEQEAIINSLPVVLYNQIIDYINTCFKTISNIKIYSFFEDNISLSFGQNYYDFIKFILKDDLYKIYQEIYILSKNANFSPTYAENISPIEREMYMSFLRQENQQSPTNHETSNVTNLPVSAPLAEFDTFASSIGG